MAKKFVAIENAQVPASVLATLVEMTRHLVLPAHATPVGCVQALVHDDGTATFLMSDVKSYGDHAGAEHLLYLVDATAEGSVAGYGEIRFAADMNPRPYFKGKPFVGRSHDEPAFASDGRALRRLAHRRLALMAALSLEAFGYPLHSDTLLTGSAVGVWEEEVKAGRAERFTETAGNHRRYRMLPPAEQAA